MTYLYYWKLVKAFLQLNKISIQRDYRGYAINPVNETITIYSTFRRYKMPISNLERFYKVLQYDDEGI